MIYILLRTVKNGTLFYHCNTFLAGLTQKQVEKGKSRTVPTCIKNRPHLRLSGLINGNNKLKLKDRE